MILQDCVGDGGALGFAAVFVEDLFMRFVASFVAQREGENVMTRGNEDDQLKRGLLEAESSHGIGTLVYDLKRKISKSG